MTDLQLFPDDGIVRPPGVPETARPDDGRLYPCPKCERPTLYWLTLTYAACDFEAYPDCGYVWTRSAQLHHSESLPI